MSSMSAVQLRRLLSLVEKYVLLGNKTSHPKKPPCLRRPRDDISPITSAASIPEGILSVGHLARDEALRPRLIQQGTLKVS